MKITDQMPIFNTLEDAKNFASNKCFSFGLSAIYRKGESYYVLSTSSKYVIKAVSSLPDFAFVTAFKNANVLENILGSKEDKKKEP